MAISINFSQAVNLFINHLNKGNVAEKWIKIYKQSLQGPFKRLIADELKVYPLNLTKVKDRSSKHRQYSFSYAINTFHSFIHDDPHLSNDCFGEALAEMEKRLIGLSPVTLKMIKQTVLQIVTIDIDELEVSHIPEKVIHDCMELSPSLKYRIGRRLFKFLIHARILDSTYLPTCKSTLIRAMEQAPNSICGHLNVQEACGVFSRHLWREKTMQYAAIRARYNHINAFSMFLGTDRQISTITQDDIVCYLNHLERERGYSPFSRATILSDLRSFFSFFTAQKAIKCNPTRNIRIKKPKKNDKTAISEEELTLIFKSAYLNYQQYENVLLTDYKLTLERWLAARDWAIISLLICTGIRTKEIASLHIDSVDLRERMIKIKGKGDGAHKIKERVIPVTEPIALSAVEIYLKLRPVSIFPHLFLSHRFEPLQYTGFANAINKITSQVLPRKQATITQIRKSFINLCAEKAIDPLILKQIMGHNSLATTMKYYLSVREQYLREVWEKNNPLAYFRKKEYEEWII